MKPGKIQTSKAPERAALPAPPIQADPAAQPAAAKADAPPAPSSAPSVDAPAHSFLVAGIVPLGTSDSAVLTGTVHIFPDGTGELGDFSLSPASGKTGAILKLKYAMRDIVLRNMSRVN